MVSRKVKHKLLKSILIFISLYSFAVSADVNRNCTSAQNRYISKIYDVIEFKGQLYGVDSFDRIIVSSDGKTWVQQCVNRMTIDEFEGSRRIYSFENHLVIAKFDNTPLYISENGKDWFVVSDYEQKKPVVVSNLINQLIRAEIVFNSESETLYTRYFNHADAEIESTEIVIQNEIQSDSINYKPTTDQLEMAKLYSPARASSVGDKPIPIAIGEENSVVISRILGKEIWRGKNLKEWKNVYESKDDSKLTDLIWTGNEFIAIGENRLKLHSENGSKWVRKPVEIGHVGNKRIDLLVIKKFKDLLVILSREEGIKTKGRLLPLWSEDGVSWEEGRLIK